MGLCKKKQQKTSKQKKKKKKKKQKKKKTKKKKKKKKKTGTGPFFDPMAIMWITLVTVYKIKLRTECQRPKPSSFTQEGF